MSIFSKLKEKVLGKREEAVFEDEVRSHVLGEYPPPPPSPFERAIEPPPTQAFEERLPPTYEPLQKTRMEPKPRYGENIYGPYDTERAYAPEIPAGPEQFAREPGRPVERVLEERGVQYEVLDRLRVIETQIATIRAQTETINERLKGLEIQLRARRSSYY